MCRQPCSPCRWYYLVVAISKDIRATFLKGDLLSNFDPACASRTFWSPYILARRARERKEEHFSFAFFAAQPKNNTYRKNKLFGSIKPPPPFCRGRSFKLTLPLVATSCLLDRHDIHFWLQPCSCLYTNKRFITMFSLNQNSSNCSVRNKTFNLARVQVFNIIGFTVRKNAAFTHNCKWQIGDTTDAIVCVFACFPKRHSLHFFGHIVHTVCWEWESSKN